MLKIQFVRNPLEVQQVFSEFNAESATWLVSDLKSKFELGQKCLNKNGFVRADSVMRASELWSALLLRLRPDLQAVSRDFIVTLIDEQLIEHPEAWARTPGAGKVAFDYLTLLMPLLTHPEGEEIIQEWFTTRPEVAQRWAHWYRLAADLWLHFLTVGSIAPAWICGVLVNENNFAKVWRRPLIVNLGVELTAVESDVLLQISDQLDVTILQPKPEWHGEFKGALANYKVFTAKQGAETLPQLGLRAEAAPSHQSVSGDGAGARSGRRFKKFTTALAEVKDATAQVREWLEVGDVKTSEIAIAAPDIEEYWPALNDYFAHEGLPVQKHQVQRLHNFTDIARWLAYLRLRSGACREADVEFAFFDPYGNGLELLSYERFATLYSRLYGPEDLGRSSAVAEMLNVNEVSQGSLTRDEFIVFALKSLPAHTDFSRVELLFKRIFIECPATLQLNLRRWLSLLEQVAARVECRLVDGDAGGVALVNLTSVENLSVKKIFVLGLTEANLRHHKTTAVLQADADSLEYEFGFRLAPEERSNLEFEIRWFSDDVERDLIFTFAESDFAGKPQAPSWFWLRESRLAGAGAEVSLPAKTRWDELQSHGLAATMVEREIAPERAVALRMAIENDIGKTELAAFAKGKISKISPSMVEDYLRCPFIFAAKNIFHLSDKAELDLEVDPSRRGSLMHALFELLTEEPFQFNLSEADLDTKIEQARTLSDLELAEQRIWPSQKRFYAQLARRFLAVESEYRRRFTDVTTIARELPVRGFIRVATGELIASHEPGAIPFSGRIDRVDRDIDGNLAIYDYKSSGSSVSQHTRWIQDGRLQLLFYAQAIENGLSELAARPVLAAFYFVAKPMSRDIGFKVEGVEQKLFNQGGAKHNRITEENKRNLFKQSGELLKKVLDGIANGRFTPQPRDQSDCKNCRWSALCRAPHLNH